MNKKFTAVVASLLLVMSLAVTGCNTTKNNSKNNADSGTKTDTSTVNKNPYTEIKKAASPKKLPEAAKTRKDTLIVGVDAPKAKFNPLYSNSTTDSWVCSLVYDGLVSIDEKGTAVPNVASEWKLSDDGKTYTFKLREDVKFSDGTALTADDVAFTYTALCDPKYMGTYGSYFRNLVGYKEYARGNANEVSGIKVNGKNEISFTFKEVKAPVIYDFALGILEKQYYDFKKGEIDKLNDKMLKPVGTGPYKLTDYKENSEINFEKNTAYFKGEPSIPKIQMKIDTAVNQTKALLTGEIDMYKLVATTQNVTSLEQAGFLDLYIYENNGYHYIGLNLRKDMFKDKNVRQALMYGLNRKAFIESYYGAYGIVCNVPFPRGSWAYPDNVNEYAYDKEKAKKMLEDAGWTLKEDGYRYNKDGKKFTINWSTYEGNKYIEKLIPFVKDSWKELGVEVIDQAIPFSDLVQKVYDKQDFDMYNMSWTLGADPDPSLIFSASEDVLGGYNSVGWKNEKSEKLITDALKETDQEKRKDIYKQWASLVNDELPYLFLNQNKEIYAVSSRVKNLDLSSYTDWTTNIHKLTLEAEQK